MLVARLLLFLILSELLFSGKGKFLFERPCSFEISHFAVQILPVDIQTKLRKFQDVTKIPGGEKTDWGIETGS